MCRSEKIGIFLILILISIDFYTQCVYNIIKDRDKELDKMFKFDYYGIRGTDNKEEINNVLETSYVWDYENDCCTYGQENEEELGGVCVTFVSDSLDQPNTPDNLVTDMFETEQELKSAIEAATEFAKKNQSGYKYYYLVGADERNPYGMQEADDNEAILADAIVLREV